MADAYFTVPADACDDGGRLVRNEVVVAHAGDRVPHAQAETWGLTGAKPADQAPLPKRARKAGQDRARKPDHDR